MAKHTLKNLRCEQLFKITNTIQNSVLIFSGSLQRKYYLKHSQIVSQNEKYLHKVSKSIISKTTLNNFTVSELFSF